MAAPVVAAVDPVTVDLAPVRFGALVAAQTGAPLSVASVFANDEVIERLVGGQLGEDLPRDASAALERAVQHVRAGPASVSADALPLGATTAPRGLAFAAVETGAALLVVGSREGTPAGRTAVGRTAARLLDGAPCAVALVPAGWDGPPEWDVVGAGFVASVEGRAAAKGAHLLADRAGAWLRVLAAVQRRGWMEGADEEVLDDLRSRAQNAAAADVATLLGAPVNLDVVLGDPADALVGVSHELDVLVCGARGYGPERATLMGGVAREVTARAACPVIVLARGPGVTLQALVD